MGIITGKDFYCFFVQISGGCRIIKLPVNRSFIFKHPAFIRSRKESCSFRICLDGGITVFQFSVTFPDSYKNIRLHGNKEALIIGLFDPHFKLFQKI